MEIERLSTNIFETGGHLVTYNQHSSYLDCSCPGFKFDSKCNVANYVRRVLESEGNKVVYRRVPHPIFVSEIERFGKSIRKILGDGKDYTQIY